MAANAVPPSFDDAPDAVPVLSFEDGACRLHTAAASPGNDGESSPQPRLFLGSRKVAESEDDTRKLGVTAVVNCAPLQVPRPPWIDASRYMELEGLGDGMKMDEKTKAFAHDDIRPFLSPTADFVRAALSDGHSVLVHCAGGVSRSATVVLAALMLLCAVSLRDAFQHVQAVRNIGPNASFVHSLIDLEEKLHGGTATVKRPLSLHQRKFVFVDE
jgi:predicted protein tyrosine phosphatase